MTIVDPLHSEEMRLFRNRIYTITIMITFIFSILASRLWYLQIINGEKYSELSKGNRIRIVSEAPLREVIFDRNSEILAGNLPYLSVAID